MKPKFKNKFRAVVSTALSLFMLIQTSLPVSAMSGDNTGGSTGDISYADNTPFSYLGRSDDFAWRADLYVSKNADGRINEDADAIGGNLALVGSVLCTSKNYANVTTYIQTNFTNNRQDIDTKGSTTGYDSEGNMGVTTYTLPTLKEFEPADGIYEDASGHIVVKACCLSRNFFAVFDKFLFYH